MEFYNNIEGEHIFNTFYDNIDLSSFPDIINKLIGKGKQKINILLFLSLQSLQDKYINSLLNVRLCIMENTDEKEVLNKKIDNNILFSQEILFSMKILVKRNS